MTVSSLFITGAGRSGTTLLDKLISLHPDASVLSQPLPLLYVAVKRAFLARTGRLAGASMHYPLSDMTGENYYPPAEFARFLAAFQLQEDFCRDVLLRQIPYDGQYDKPQEPLAVLADYRSGSLKDFVEHYIDFYAAKPAARVCGSKETQCEEFVPYFAGGDVSVILVVRDPRDILVSLDYGRGRQFGGRRKPVLFNIRQWRKSVACALAYEQHPSVLVIRYEDLVSEPMATLSRLTSFLELEPFRQDVLTAKLRSQSGGLWFGNSSHSELSSVSDQPVGRYRSYLKPDLDRFVQALCYAELQQFGYAVEIDPDAIPRIFAGYVEAEPLERQELANYQWNTAGRDEELTRWQALLEGRFDRIWFPFEQAFARLRSSLRKAPN